MQKKQNAIFIIILLLIFLACAVLWLWSGDTVTHILSDDGTRDLRAADFTSDRFDLYGPVEYIPSELLTPEEFEARQGEIQIGGPSKADQFGTSRLRVFVPKGTYGLIMWNAEYAAKIYINGRHVESVGAPDENAERSVASLQILYYTADAPNGAIEIVQQASNHVVQNGHGHDDIIIGTPKAIREMYAKQNIIAAVVMGCFLVLFLAHLVLYSMLRFYKANLWFALFCLMWFLSVGCSQPLILSSLLPLSWASMTRLVYLASPIGLLLLYMTFSELFPGVLQKWLRGALCFVCALFACVYLFADMMTASEVFLYFNVVILLMVTYLLIRLYAKLKKPSIEQIAILIGMGVFILGVLCDILQFSLIPTFLSAPPRPNQLSWRTTAEYTLLVFVFFQMTVMFRSTVREITAAKEQEQKLIMENALLAREAKVREDMVRDLSHEVRTPLTVISTYTQLAVRQFRQGKIDEQTIDGLDAVYEAANRVAELATNTLLPRENEERVADLAEIAMQLVRLHTPMTQAAGRTLNVNLNDRLLTACSIGEITQVIWNLLDNAIKHGEHGDINVDGNKSDEYVYVIITDYGAGIPPDMLPKIFERGVSGAGGSGLGLAIANEIVQKHGGKLIIESEYRFGTTATLLLPAYLKKEREPYEE